MSPRSTMSLIELQYFKDEIIRITSELKPVIEASETSNLNDKFIEVEKLFLELRELSHDLGAVQFYEFFNGFVEILALANMANNERANKKVFLMCLDYQELLENLGREMNNKDRLKGILKAFEVLTFKQDRLKRGEFYSLTQETPAPQKKQRAV